MHSVLSGPTHGSPSGSRKAKQRTQGARPDSLRVISSGGRDRVTDGGLLWDVQRLRGMWRG